MFTNDVLALSANGTGYLLDVRVKWTAWLLLCKWRLAQKLPLFPLSSAFGWVLFVCLTSPSHKRRFCAPQYGTSDCAWHVKHQTGGLPSLNQGYLCLGSPKGGSRQIPRSRGFVGYGCPRVCPQHTMEIMSQWPLCLASVGRAGEKSGQRMELQLP